MIYKKILLVALFGAALGLSQTATASFPVTKSNTVNTTVMPSTEEGQLSVGFCERLLEKWCRSYYKECFSLRYKENSLSMVEIVESNSDGSVIRLKGLHSFEGFTGTKTYNDVEFHAVIYCKRSNSYEIWFEKYRPFWGTWQSATRTVYYE